MMMMHLNWRMGSEVTFWLVISVQEVQSFGADNRVEFSLHRVEEWVFML